MTCDYSISFAGRMSSVDEEVDEITSCSQECGVLVGGGGDDSKVCKELCVPLGDIKLTGGEIIDDLAEIYLGFSEEEAQKVLKNADPRLVRAYRKAKRNAAKNAEAETATSSSPPPEEEEEEGEIVTKDP